MFTNVAIELYMDAVVGRCVTSFIAMKLYCEAGILRGYENQRGLNLRSLYFEKFVNFLQQL